MMENLKGGKDYKMQEFISLLNYTFMQRALICGIAISFCAALIGVILVLKNYSMIGHGLRRSWICCNKFGYGS